MWAYIDEWVSTGGLGWVDSGAGGNWLIISAVAAWGATEWGKVDAAVTYEWWAS